MRNLFRIISLVFLMMTTCTIAFAQGPNHGADKKEQKISREKLAKKQAKFIANELSLSGEKEDKFVETYCEYQKEIWQLGPRNHKKKNMNEKETEQSIKDDFEKSEKMLSIRHKYYKKYSKFLSQSQIAKVYELEKKMIQRFAKHRKDKHDKKDKNDD